MISKVRTPLFLLIVLVILSSIVSACSTNHPSKDLRMASMDQMPSEVQAAPVTVQQAYQFAVASPAIMKDIPCYCGCGNIGHTSNYNCYVANVDDKGKVTFDRHALGCSICVDITQDVLRLLRDGKSPQEVRAYIDNTYSKYGPSNIP